MPIRRPAGKLVGMRMRRDFRAVLADAVVFLFYAGPPFAGVAASFAFNSPTNWIVMGLGFLWPIGVLAVGLYQGCD